MLVLTQMSVLALVAFLLSLCCIALAKPLAKYFGLVDRPGGRKVHRKNTPLVGGLGMYLALLITAMFVPGLLSAHLPFFVLSGLLLLLGLIDDYCLLSAKLKLLAQCVIVIAMVEWAGLSLTHLGDIIGVTIQLQWFSLPLTVFAVLCVINALNMTDGLDGLAGSLVLVALLAMVASSWQKISAADLAILVMLTTVIIAFLCFNLRAKVFMGDAGSLFLGFSLAWYSLALTQGANSPIHPVVMLWFLAMPLYDLLTVVIQRLRRGLSPFHPGRDHLHHWLLDRGFSARQTTGLITTAALCFALLALVAEKAAWPESWLFVSYLLGYLGYFYLRSRS